MSCFTQEQLSKISNLVREIEKLSDIEKLLLYLQLPCGRADITEGKYKVNGKSNPELFSKKPDQETTQTYTWILSHLEEDPSVSLPKQEVYDEYKAFCQVNRFEPLCVADFGKAMKHAFPCIKPRRLGQRGNSKYCYSGLRKKYRIQPPCLLDLSNESTMNSPCSDVTNVQPTTQQQQHVLNRSQHRQQTQVAHDATTTTTNPTANEPMNQQHQHHHHHHHHQQPQHEVTSCCYEAINLKIEPSLLADGHNHQHNHHQHGGSRPSHVSSCSDNGLYVGVHQQQPHIRHDGDDNMTQPAEAQGSGGPQTTSTTTIMSISNQTPQTPTAASEQQAHATMNHSLGDYNTASGGGGGGGGGSSATSVVTAPTNHHERTDYPYPGIIQRFGTPDDDDYNHNYQDLNRPIVSAVIPFSQTGQQSTCGFAYGGHHAPPAASSSASTLHHHPHHSHQTHQPAASDTIHQSTNHRIVSQSNSCAANNKLLHSNPPHSFQSLNLNSRQQATTNSHTMTSTTMTNSSSSSTTRQQHEHHHHQHSHSHHHHQQPATSDGSQQPAEAPAATSTNRHNHLDDQNQYQSTTSNNHPPHLQLSINNNNNFQDQFSSYNRLNHSSIDCCASPFQSPASTPYPMIGNGFSLTNEMHDYYPSDCIRYAEQ